MRVSDIVWDKHQETTSSAQLSEFHSSVSLTENLEQWVSPHLLLVAILVLLTGVGEVLVVLSGAPSDSLRTPFFGLFVVNLVLAVETILWLDRTGIDTIERIRPAFAMSDREYYTFMGQMVERIYEPLPHTPRPDGRKVHRPVTIFFVLGLVCLVFVPMWIEPEWMSNLIGVQWSTLPIGMKLYFIGILAVATVIGVLTSWIVVTGAVYMGYRVRDVRINLDVTRARDNLGLAPYASLTLRALFLYLLAYFVTTLVVFREPSRLYISVALIMSVLPMIGLVGSQYGLHVAIARSKQVRLEELRDEFSDDIDQWFYFEDPEPTDVSGDEREITEFLSAKEAIEDLPDWPINVGSVAQLVSATFASNVWVGLQIVGVV